MGGRIGVSSRLGQGSRFWVELPFDVPSRQSVALPSGVGEASSAGGHRDTADAAENVIAFSDPFLRHRARVRSMRILIADDHAANRLVLERLLRKAGHRVTSVDSGEDVLSAMEQAEFDAAIVDLHMPDMSGLDLLHHLRVLQAGAPAKTPVMVLSADVTPDAIEACRRAGAWEFLAKPVATSRLLELLGNLANGVAPTAAPVAARGEGGLAANVFDPGVLDELRSLGLGESFEREFIVQCLRDAEECLMQLSQGGDHGDWDRIREQAHALKGASASVGGETFRGEGILAVTKAIAAQIGQTEASLLASSNADAQAIGRRLKAAREAFLETVDFIASHARSQPNAAFAGSVPYLMLAGNLMAGWQLGRSALAALSPEAQAQDAAFMAAKLNTARFYADHLLSRAPGVRDAIVHGSEAINAMALDAF